MYKIDKDTNEIVPLQSRSFSELGFKERVHLQEWIAKQPSCLGEDFLIIQKEFAGFSDTQERLDLLALDKGGSLVVIENKLDDTGRDVTWQALKYASYCSSLSKDDIRQIYQDFLTMSGNSQRAEDLLVEFFEAEDYEEIALNTGITQRIILLAANFRKEVTSTVLWLLNFKMRVQCFKVTPFGMADQLFLNVEQIIPTKEAEEYMIGLAEKARDEAVEATDQKKRHNIRRKFWAQLILEMNNRSDLYQNISPGTSSWLSAGSGTRGVGFNFGATKAYGRAEIYIDRGNFEENKWFFDQLFERKGVIENAFGGPLVWERLDQKRSCRIKAEESGNIYDPEQWPEMIAFMVDAMSRMESAFRAILDEISSKLRAKP